MLVNVLFDGLLQFPSAAEHPAAQLLLESAPVLANQRSTWFSQELLVGVKCR